MKSLSKQYEVLVSRMKDYELYHIGDDIHHELILLKDMIDEVEKRMFCIGKTTKEISDTISQFTDDIGGGAPFTMLASDHEVIQRGANDIKIALDLNDNEPIENNWYSLFNVRFFKVTSDIHNSVSGKIFDVLHISLNEKGERMGELNARDPEDERYNLWVNLDLEGICLTEEQMKDEVSSQKNNEIKTILIDNFDRMNMDLPSNFEEILDYVVADVEETADPRNWNDSDVAIAFRRWIESK
jgi:hypothetical protein